MRTISCHECGAVVSTILYWVFNTCSNGGGHRLQPIEVQAIYLRTLAQADQEAAVNEETE